MQKLRAEKVFLRVNFINIFITHRRLNLAAENHKSINRLTRGKAEETTSCHVTSQGSRVLSVITHDGRRCNTSCHEASARMWKFQSIVTKLCACLLNRFSRRIILNWVLMNPLRLRKSRVEAQTTEQLQRIFSDYGNFLTKAMLMNYLEFAFIKLFCI